MAKAVGSWVRLRLGLSLRSPPSSDILPAVRHSLSGPQLPHTPPGAAARFSYSQEEAQSGVCCLILGNILGTWEGGAPRAMHLLVSSCSFLLCGPAWPRDSTPGQSRRKPAKPVNKIEMGHSGSKGLFPSEINVTGTNCWSH